MKRSEMLAALKDRIQPLENSEAGLLCGGFTQIGISTMQSGANNGDCPENGSCYDNSNCATNGSCGNNPSCAGNGACSRNGLCASNVLCNNNTTCNNNARSENNDSCNAKPTDSAGNDILDYSAIF